MDDTKGQKQLYRKVFGDSAELTDEVFRRAAHCFCVFKDGETASVALALNKKLFANGKEVPIYFLVGVCTDERYRRKGYMRAVLEQAQVAAKRDDIAYIMLATVKPELYSPLGFLPLVKREEYKCTGGATRYTIKESNIEFLAHRYAKIVKKADMYAVRNADYYARLEETYRAEGTSVIKVFEDGKAIGYIVAESDGRITETDITEDILKNAECLKGKFFEGFTVMYRSVSGEKLPESAKIVFYDKYL